MMTAKQCRTKALEALANAERMDDASFKANYQHNARQWATLADMVDIQDALLALQPA